MHDEVEMGGPHRRQVVREARVAEPGLVVHLGPVFVCRVHELARIGQIDGLALHAAQIAAPPVSVAADLLDAFDPLHHILRVALE